MSLQAQLEADLKDALRQGDDVRKGTIRLVLASLKNQQIENRAPLDLQQELSVLQREAKRRREAADEYERLGRGDLAQKELAEHSVIETYLPQQLGHDEVRALVQQAIQSTGASSQRDMGRVMSALMPQVKGRADGKVLSQMVRETLAARESAG